MKFPIVTVTLVSAALLFVLWDQTREQPQAVDASRFTNLQANPVKLSTTVDWLITQLPSLCEQATGKAEGTDANASCVKQAKTRTSTCRRSIYDGFPSVVASEAAFRDVSITLINCLVQDASP
ncbi:MULTISPECIES: hypothetical protein [Marinobacter]|uniref:UrcA family protein n=1 Tax=Marinobacter xiaoshiensis TaxID=3073652 RepID=A0ABU2HEY9_9GAMM|nr:MULTISPECIES: hypothetical protein [unclassified Marinobacter]MBK1885126.1 hypothetical protein [Marinobacter sp. DY40_1A1]MDS1309200.1 hypothetical protein [Marinobacter sp. F60267]